MLIKGVDKLITKTTHHAINMYRIGTSQLRSLPDFIIIGAQKGGTTFLYDILRYFASSSTTLK